MIVVTYSESKLKAATLKLQKSCGKKDLTVRLIKYFTVGQVLLCCCRILKFFGWYGLFNFKISHNTSDEFAIGYSLAHYTKKFYCVTLLRFCWLII